MPGRRGLRLTALAGLAACGVLVLGNGFDRASARHPALAAYVPAALKAEAWRSQSAASLQAGDNKAAIASAERAVAADPIDPRSTALLGAGQLASGKRIEADASFRVAARFGWRDPLTQLYFMNAALNAGQPRLAAMRLDAVLRQAPDFPVREMLLAQFEGTPDGRAALAERLALQPPWTSAFMSHVGSVPLDALKARAAIVAGLQSPKWGCDAVAPLVTKLVLSQAVSEAKALWLAQCPAAAPGLADPLFMALPAARASVPFEWTLVGSGDVSSAPASQQVSGQHGLLARVGGPVPQMVAWQLLALPPGRYQLSWTARTAAGEAANGFTVSLSCVFGSKQPLPANPTPGEKGRFSAAFTPDASCAGQYLTLWLAPGPDEVQIDDLSLTRP